MSHRMDFFFEQIRSSCIVITLSEYKVNRQVCDEAVVIAVR